MLRIILFSIICFAPNLSIAQHYIQAQAQAYRTETITFGGGGLISTGYQINDVSFGGGLGVLQFGGPNTYVPVFAEVAYRKSDMRIMPTLRAQIGYGFTNGAGDLKNNKRQLNRGLFFNPHVGGSFKLHRHTGLVFVGTTIMVSNKEIERRPNLDVYVTPSDTYVLFTAGISFTFSNTLNRQSNSR
ncbi:MAG TPA: hypothetical protein VD996_02680 [Chitinophagaceae bacterium]|nr:hypothetical protein [Chitinophagaceae bacterium]